MFNAAESNVDYTQFLDGVQTEKKYLFQQNLHGPLVDFILRITNCGKYGHKNDLDNHKDTFKVQMLLGIMCNMINRQAVLVQNLMGLTLFTGVVKDKVIDIFSAFGISCSALTINNEIQHCDTCGSSVHRGAGQRERHHPRR